MRDPVQRNVPTRPGGGGGDAAGSGKPAEQSGATGTMSIGEVLGILKPEFPDITVSKIRFLEGAGLVQPDRSASGYRKFSEDDVARLRFVLRAQRDQYLPLRVIRQRLTDLEQVGGLDTKPGQAAVEPPALKDPRPDPPGRVRPGAEAGPGSEASGSQVVRGGSGQALRAPRELARGRLRRRRPGRLGRSGRPGPGHRDLPAPERRRGWRGGWFGGCWGAAGTGDGRGIRGRAAVRRAVHPRRAAAAPPEPTWSSSWNWSRSAS